MLGVVFRSVMMSRPFAAPLGLPAERLAMLRAAFEAAVKDFALIGEAAKTGMKVEFISPARIEDNLKATFATDPALIEKVRNAYSGKYNTSKERSVTDLKRIRVDQVGSLCSPLPLGCVRSIQARRSDNRGAEGGSRQSHQRHCGKAE